MILCYQLILSNSALNCESSSSLLAMYKVTSIKVLVSFGLSLVKKIDGAVKIDGRPSNDATLTFHSYKLVDEFEGEVKLSELFIAKRCATLKDD